MKITQECRRRRELVFKGSWCITPVWLCFAAFLGGYYLALHSSFSIYLLGLVTLLIIWAGIWKLFGRLSIGSSRAYEVSFWHFGSMEEKEYQLVFEGWWRLLPTLLCVSSYAVGYHATLHESPVRYLTPVSLHVICIALWGLFGRAYNQEYAE